MFMYARMSAAAAAARERKLRSVKKALDTLRFLIIHSEIMSISEHNSYHWANQIARKKDIQFQYLLLYKLFGYGI